MVNEEVGGEPPTDGAQEARPAGIIRLTTLTTQELSCLILPTLPKLGEGVVGMPTS